MTHTKCQHLFESIHQMIDNRFLYGQQHMLDLLLISYLCKGHVLIEGPPGTGKTLTARLLAHLLAKSFKRIQFTSDLLPADIIGAHIFSPKIQEFSFIPGPLFSDFILADEINRTPPRTQSALLEAMEERQVTVEGKQFELDDNFFVIATQNSQEFEGTFPLPEAQMDRFMLQLNVNHNTAEVEVEMLRGFLNGGLPPEFDNISPVEFDRSQIEAEINQVRVDDSITQYISNMVSATRQHSMLQWGSSFRGGLALLKAARVLSLIRSRDFVTPDDIQELLIPTLQHRVKLTPEAQVSQVKANTILKEVLNNTAFPT